MPLGTTFFVFFFGFGGGEGFKRGLSHSLSVEDENADGDGIPD